MALGFICTPLVLELVGIDYFPFLGAAGIPAYIVPVGINVREYRPAAVVVVCWLFAVGSLAGKIEGIAVDGLFVAGSEMCPQRIGIIFILVVD